MRANGFMLASMILTNQSQFDLKSFLLIQEVCMHIQSDERRTNIDPELEATIESIALRNFALEHKMRPVTQKHS